MPRILSLFILFTFASFTSCQNYTFGPPRSTANYQQAMTSQNKAEFESFDVTKNDKLGMWIFVGVISAAAVASSILVPLYVSDKL